MLTEEKVNVRIRLAALWTSVLFCFIYADYFELYAPGKVESLISGNNVLDSPAKLLIASVVLAIPSGLIAMTVLLKAKISRFLNIFFGVVYTLMMLLIAFTSFTKWYGFYVLYAFLESFLTMTIIWQAWHWPKAE